MLFAMEWSLRHFDEEKMHNTRHYLDACILQHDTLSAFFQSIDSRLYATPAATERVALIAFSDTFLFNPLENEMEPFLHLAFPVKMRDQIWRVDLFQSSVEREDIAATIAVLVPALFVLLFGVLLWVNRLVSRRVWKPFFRHSTACAGFDPLIQICCVYPIHLFPNFRNGTPDWKNWQKKYNAISVL